MPPSNTVDAEKTETKVAMGTNSIEKEEPTTDLKKLLFCFVGLQVSYLTWGYVQEKVMTKECVACPRVVLG